MPFLPGHPAELAAQLVHGPVPGQHDQVGAQRPGRGVVPAGVAPQFDEDVLDHVLRGGPLAEDAQRGSVYGRPKPVEGLGQCVIVPGRQAGGEQRIGRLHPWDASAVPGHRATR